MPRDWCAFQSCHQPFHLPPFAEMDDIPHTPAGIGPLARLAGGLRAVGCNQGCRVRCVGPVMDIKR